MGKKASNPGQPKAPTTWNEHALERFIDRWWPIDVTTPNNSTAPIVRAIRERTALFAQILRSRAVYVDDVPDEDVQIWGFYMTEGPFQGYFGLMVVDRKGVVRTVLPPATRRK